MSIVSTLISIKLAENGLNRLIPISYAKRFIKERFYYKEGSFNDDDSTINFIKHETNDFLNNRIFCYELINNNSDNYIFIIPSLKRKYDDNKVLIDGFSKLGYNIFYFDYIGQISYGIKEASNLLIWLKYFNVLYPNANITLYGEDDGANIIVRSLSFKDNDNVKCAILDNVIVRLKDEMINNFINDYSIKSKQYFENSVNNYLKRFFNFNLNDLIIDNDLKMNELPLCFIYCRNKSNYNYRELLKLYNRNKSEHKFLYCESLIRNCFDKNYFLILDKYIKNSCINLQNKK